jgi:Mg2+ and Co2+ transporter CorA
MKDYSRVATELSRTGNAQSNSLNIIAHEAKHDTRMMKVLTIIAIAYVPASVIAVQHPLSSFNLQLSR